MNNKILLSLLVLFLTVSCGGGGGGYVADNSGDDSPSSSLANLNQLNACKKAWYTTTFPDPTTNDPVFNNYTFFWQTTSLDAMPICINKYEATNTITSTGGKAWDLYVKEIAEYSKYTLGQIVPVNIFILGATPLENVTDAEKATYNTDFQTVQSRVGANYSTDLANGNIFPIDSAGGGYSFEAAPNGADMQLPQGLVWDKPGEYANDNEKIQGAFKVIAHEYFHVYQNSIKFYNETNKTISIPKTWQSTPSIVNNPQGDPAYFPWWIEEGGADFGAIVMSAKFANAQAGIDVDTVINPVQQFKDHFTRAHQLFNADPDLKLSSYNLPPSSGTDYAYQVGTAALLYAWHKDVRNFNAAMSKYYTDWQEAEKELSGKGFEEAFYDAFWKNSTEYYTLTEFDEEFRAWIRDGDAENRWAVVAKTADQIVHTNIEPTTPNTPTSSTKTITVAAAAKVIDNGGVNKYFIDGIQQKTLVVKAGSIYKFSHGSTHPLRFSTTEDGTHNGGVAYESGVTVNSGANEVQLLAPNSSSTKTLYYYCASHPGMGGKIKIVEQFTSSSSSSPSSGNSGGGGGYGY